MLSVLYFWLGLGPGLDLATAGLGFEAKKLRPSASASLMWPDLVVGLMHLRPRSLNIHG